MLLHAEEDINTRSDWAGQQGLWSEVRYGLTLDGVPLVIQGEENLGGVLEVLNRGTRWEELVPDKENEFQEGPELNCPVVACAFGVLAGPEAEV